MKNVLMDANPALATWDIHPGDSCDFWLFRSTTELSSPATYKQTDARCGMAPAGRAANSPGTSYNMRLHSFYIYYDKNQILNRKQYH